MKKDEYPNIELSQQGKEKIEKIIKSCKTFNHITAARTMIENSYYKNTNLISAEDYQYFKNMLVKQEYVIEKNLFSGTKVIAISNKINIV